MAEGQSTTLSASVEYRDIPGFVGYRVGNDGSVWSLRRLGRRYKDALHQPLLGAEWKRLKPPLLVSGYPSFTLRENGKRFVVLVHRLVLELFVGPCPPGMECCHGDGNRANNALPNLRWDTRQANSADQEKHGTRQRGERNGHAKLTEVAVLAARERYRAGGVTIRHLADECGVSRLTMGEAVRGTTWKHVA